MVLGLVRPTSGRIRLLGHDMSKHPHRALARTGAIVEAPAFYENFSGRRNLQMLSALSGGADGKRIAEVLEMVDLTERAGDPVRVYSHGMRQRLGIAQALLPAPEFIILDEPTDGLDPDGIQQTRLLIKRMQEELGLTVMLSSHLLHEVEQLCNRIAIIDGGHLLFQGRVESLLAQDQIVRLSVDRVEEAFQLLTTDPALSVTRNGTQSLYFKAMPEHIPLVNKMLVEHGIRVMELTPERETLEQVFLRLTQKKAS
jgi:ABC-2 type transport system ATP-binding protein